MSLAFRAFFKGQGHPRFKARGRDKPRFIIPDGVKIKGDHLRIPDVGRLRLRRQAGNPYPNGKPVKASVVHECGKWYATVCYKTEEGFQPSLQNQNQAPEAAPAHQECCQHVAASPDPACSVKAKAGLNRSILSTGWSEIEQMLGYKTWVVSINPAYTSQRCSRCAQVDKASRQTQSRFLCTSCGHQDNADLNAAHNILASRIGAAARGEAFSVGTSTIREQTYVV